MINYYKNLPDYMSNEELKLEFSKFIKNIEYDDYDLIDALESLVELSDRQWHTYELIDVEIKEKIEQWLLRVINFNSEEIIEYEILVMVHLGLSKLFLIINDSLSGDLKKEIRQIIEETNAEIRDSIEDPYSGMSIRYSSVE